ncbi:MAG: alcohol dehydrogenase, alcohol dehydrogenase, propanol-preferring [Thaumarchaeota archaeon CSP1-1]|nr:MAG: alcohol dehydrogenase, alcohol dehydrogenase, propanol-preferring [Thaumarchaeota archaeon CSP1-1]
MVEKMRAMVLSELGPIETNPLKLTEIDRHEIQRPNELLIKIEACGVCHSQLHEIEGDWKDLGIPPMLPTVPGHEVVGKVVEIGKNVTKFKVGDRAGISPLLESCMKCQYCKEGNEHLCESMQVLGESLKGGYAEYVTVTEDFATKIPETMRPEYAAPLFCAGITAYKAVKASEPSKNKKIGIFGIGGVGHMAVQFAILEGADVIAISRNKKHLEIAKKLGASITITYNQDQEKFLQELKEKVGLLDAAIVFAPADIVTNTAIKAIKKGGLVVIGTIGKISNFVAFEEKTIRGTLIGSRNDMKEVIRIANEKNIKVFSEVYRLEQANEVLAKLKTSEIEARAVLVP